MLEKDLWNLSKWSKFVHNFVPFILLISSISAYFKYLLEYQLTKNLKIELF